MATIEQMYADVEEDLGYIDQVAINLRDENKVDELKAFERKLVHVLDGYGKYWEVM